MYSFLKGDGQYYISVLLIRLHSQVPVEGEQFLTLNLVSYILLQVCNLFPVRKLLLHGLLIIWQVLGIVVVPLNASFTELWLCPDRHEAWAHRLINDRNTILAQMPHLDSHLLHCLLLFSQISIFVELFLLFQLHFGQAYVDRPILAGSEADIMRGLISSEKLDIFRWAVTRVALLYATFCDPRIAFGAYCWMSVLSLLVSSLGLLNWQATLAFIDGYLLDNDGSQLMEWGSVCLTVGAIRELLSIRFTAQLCLRPVIEPILLILLIAVVVFYIHGAFGWQIRIIHSITSATIHRCLRDSDTSTVDLVISFALFENRSRYLLDHFWFQLSFTSLLKLKL